MESWKKSRVLVLVAAFLWIALKPYAQRDAGEKAIPARTSDPKFAGDTQSCLPGSAASQQSSINQKDESLPIQGLYSPATVSASIVALAAPGVAPRAVVYFLDNQPVWRVTEPPYFLGPLVSGLPVGLRIDSVPPGRHTLTACALLPSDRTLVSQRIELLVVPSVNGDFSQTLQPLRNHPSAQQLPLETLLARTSTPGASVSAEEVALRRRVLQLYVNWGIDPSLDFTNDESELLRLQAPPGAAPALGPGPGKPLSMSFSPDAPFYHRIPALWPSVPLPPGYFKSIQLNEAYNGDGIGFGEVSAAPDDPLLPVRSQWYAVASTLRTFTFRMPLDWSRHLPTLAAGDRHLIFIDPVSNTFISSYKTSVDPATGGPTSLFTSKPHSLSGLGESGGSNAAGFADLPVLLQPGEATNPVSEIPHALGGAVRRTWAARVFPANAWDAGILNSTDSCSKKGFTNTGLVPYGGVLQLDPSLDLASLNLTLPARRILRAMQVYGYYVMDYGCSDLDIYTAIDAAELDPFGGPWGNRNGVGVQTELERVLASSRIYVVPPIMKR